MHHVWKQVKMDRSKLIKHLKLQTRSAETCRKQWATAYLALVKTLLYTNNIRNSVFRRKLFNLCFYQRLKFPIPKNYYSSSSIIDLLSQTDWFSFLLPKIFLNTFHIIFKLSLVLLHNHFIAFVNSYQTSFDTLMNP